MSAVPVAPGIDIWRSCRFVGGIWTDCLVVFGDFFPVNLGLIIAD